MTNAEQRGPPQDPIWELSTDSFPQIDRLEAWHAALSPFNDIRVRPEKRHDFHAATSYWSLGRVVLTKSVASEVQLVRTNAQAARDQLDHEVVVVFQSGQSSTTSRGTRYDLAAGDVAFANLRNGYDFRIISPDTARWCELILPPDLRDRLAELGSGEAVVGAEPTPQTRLLGQFICSVAEQLPQLAAADLPMIEQALLCLMAAARCDASAPAARLSEAGRQTVDRARAVAMIDRELFSARLTADRVCDVTGISRSSLYRLFEADNGVASYIRIRRLDALRRDLADPRKQHQTVAQLSEQRGFHSHSTLNRAFRRRFGCTPQEVRTLRAHPVQTAAAAQIDGVIGYLKAQGRS